MKMSWFKWPALMAAFVMGSGLSAMPAFADDSAVKSVVESVTNVLSGQPADVATAADEAATDETAGLPKFNNRNERREYMKKLKQENPEKFNEVKKRHQERREALKKLRRENPDEFKALMEKRKQEWVQNHPEAAAKMQAWKEKHPNVGQGKDMKENRADRRENRWDRKENKLDRAEDVRDRREDVRDAKHDGGPMDKIEDRMDRREDVRDHKEDVRDHVEDIHDRNENRWDAKHGPDKGRPGYGQGRRAAKANQ